MKPHIQLLGRFRISLESQAEDIVLPRQKAAALLAILASPVGKERSRQELSSLLWGQSGASAARTNLRQALFHIRKCIPQLSGLEITPESVALTAGSVITDVQAFEAGCAGATLTDWEHAIEAYRGDFLAGSAVRERSFEEWRTGEAERLAGVRLAAHERLMEAYLDSTRHADAIRVATGCLRLDPFHEVAHETLVVAHAAQGRMEFARRRYRKFADLMTAELGVAPATSLRDLLSVGQRTRRNQSESGPDVESPALTAGLSDTPIAAVMRFHANGQGAEQLADAMAAKIVGRLGSAFPLPVLGPGRREDVGADAASMDGSHAKYIIQGGVRHCKDVWRIDYRIVETDTGCQLHAGSRDIGSSHSFDACDVAGNDIAAESAIVIELRERKRTLIGNRDPIDAWERCCGGMAILDQISCHTVLAAQVMFREALEIAPNNARVLAGLSQAVQQEGICHVGRSREETYSESLELAHRAYGLDRNDPFVNWSLGKAHHRIEQFDQALEPFQRALRMVPGNPDVSGSLGNLLSFMGQPEKGLPLIRFSMKSTDAYLSPMARSYLQMGDYKRARAWSETAVATHSENSWAYVLLGSALGHLGKKGRAYHALQKCEAIHGGRVNAEFEAAPTQYRNPRDHDHVLAGIGLAGWR